MIHTDPTNIQRVKRNDLLQNSLTKKQNSFKGDTLKAFKLIIASGKAVKTKSDYFINKIDKI